MQNNNEIGQKDLTGQIATGILIAAGIIYLGPAILAACMASLGLIILGSIAYPSIFFFGLACFVLWKVTRD